MKTNSSPLDTSREVLPQAGRALTKTPSQTSSFPYLCGMHSKAMRSFPTAPILHITCRLKDATLSSSVTCRKFYVHPTCGSGSTREGLKLGCKLRGALCARHDFAIRQLDKTTDVGELARTELRLKAESHLH